MPGVVDLPNIPTGEVMTETHVHTLTVLERTGGSISLVGVLAIFVAYYLCPRVRNVQNTFIVFASISNVGASIASLIAMDGLLKGKESGLCQAQSFMFEMFMQSDPWWALAMSINVFLVFFLRTSPDTFQKWLWLYCLVCYGGPFVIAVTLLLVRPQRGLVYGEATIWCWVDREWDDIRIYTYYLLIWVCIVGSFLCYTLVGWQVFRTRNQLHSLSTHRSRETDQNDQVRPFLPGNSSLAYPFHSPRPEPVLIKAHRRFQALKSKLTGMLGEGGYYGTVITEVQVTHSEASRNAASVLGAVPIIPSPAIPRRAYLSAPSFDECIIPMDNLDRRDDMEAGLHTGNPANRYAATVTTMAQGSGDAEDNEVKDQLASRLDVLWDAVKSAAGKFVVHDKIKRAYLRTSFLFALSVLVTWIPSSMNRIRSWTSGESPFEYHVATAAVLPLQGLWNTIIFFVTSSGAIIKSWDDLRKRYAGKGGGFPGLLAALNTSKAAANDAQAARGEPSGSGRYANDRGIGFTMSRRTVPSCDDDDDDDDDDELADNSSEGEASTLDSDAELRRTAEAPGKRSSSTASF